jgi:hypothetical protein
MKSAVDLARMGKTRNATETLDEKCESKKRLLGNVRRKYENGPTKSKNNTKILNGCIWLRIETAGRIL